MANRFSSQIIGVTGKEPLDEEGLKLLIISEGGVIGNKEVWQHDQVILIGRENFDKDYLIQSIEIGSRFRFVCEYMAHEEFAQYWFNDAHPNYYPGDPRIINHQGLSFLSSIGFTWPSTIVTRSAHRNSRTIELNDAHPLALKYGYSVRKGISEKARRERLKIAIRPSELGLEKVVCHIASLIRRNSLRDNSMDEAIQRWRDDLDWLYRNYYNPIYSFIWPSTHPL